jgi:PAS domain S-box-containing protein
MNWRSVSVHLADRGTNCAVIDHRLRVQLLSVGLERLLGRSRDEVEGRTWTEAIVPPEQRDLVEARLLRALAGTLPTFESHVVTKDGRTLVVSLESVRVGHREESGLLITAVSSRPVSTASPSEDSDADLSYEVELEAEAFGSLNALRSRHAAEDATRALGERCYTVLHGRARPCADCPMLLPPATPWPRTVTRRLPGEPVIYEVISANIRGECASVRSRRIPGAVISAVHEAKVNDLATDAQLSDREREVLRYLMMGRSLADIAMLLNISLRTVKYHQANVLEKLGADSRSDLIRLLA